MVTSNPFTPQSGWEPKIFGGREEHLNHFEKTLAEAASSRANHMVLIGQWGIGKTSLLKQFKKISQAQGYPASFCPLSQAKERSSLSAVTKLIMEEIVSGFPQPMKIHLTAKQKLQPQMLFTKFLLDIFPRLNSRLGLILLDDIQNLSAVSSIIDLLRAVLSKEEIINQTKFLFVLSSTPEGWEQFINKHDPVGRFFRRRELITPLSFQETNTVIEKTLQGTGVTFQPEIIEEIFRYTQGHPYETQLLASHLFETQIQRKVTLNEWASAFSHTVRELGRDYFHMLYARASDREREVLQVLAEARKALPQGEIRRIMIVEKHAKNFPVANIKNFLYRLHDKGLVKRHENGNFQILDPFFGEYILQENK